MYKNKFVSELTINEVKEYFDKLRCYKFPWTKEESRDFAICRERLVMHACKTLEQTDALDKIRAEIKSMDFDFGDFYDHTDQIIEKVCEVIDKYRK